MIPSDSRYLVMHLADACVQLQVSHPQGNRWIDWLPTDKNDTVLQAIIAPSPLYEGADGNALFLSQAGKCLGNEVWEQAGTQALAYGYHEAMLLLQGALLDLSPCAFTGTILSSIYAHAYVFEQNQNTEVLLKLDTMLHALEKKGVDSFNIAMHDYIGGVSSGLLLLARLYLWKEVAKHQPWLKSWMVVWSDRLCTLINGVATPKTGVAHGLAGWYIALATANSILKNEYYEQLVVAWQNEILTQLPEMATQAHVSKTWWCAGLPGIAQAMVRVGDDQTNLKQAQHWLEVSSQLDAGELDHLCCGEVGRMYAVNSACNYLGKDLIWKSDRILKRFSKDGQWQYQLFKEGAITPGAMTGAPGIGLALLQSLFPKKNPCIFTLDIVSAILEKP